MESIFVRGLSNNLLCVIIDSHLFTGSSLFSNIKMVYQFTWKSKIIFQFIHENHFIPSLMCQVEYIHGIEFTNKIYR